MGEVRRRIPNQTVADKTCQWIYYLGELERQADLFDRSFQDGMAAATRDDPTDTWRHLQSALFAGIIVNRLLTGRGARQPEAALKRAKYLRELVGLDAADHSSPILTLHTVRDHLEHFDERLDTHFTSPTTLSISDFYLSDGRYFMSGGSDSSAVFRGLRAFNPDCGLLHFDRTPLDMFLLDIDMLVLKNNARETQHELLQKVRGRQPFAAIACQLDEADRRRRGEWEKHRASMIASMNPPVELSPQVRVYLSLEGEV